MSTQGLAAGVKDPAMTQSTPGAGEDWPGPAKGSVGDVCEQLPQSMRHRETKMRRERDTEGKTETTMASTFPPPVALKLLDTEVAW